MFITYQEKNFRKETLDLIDLSNEIIEEYEEQDYSLTLRQLYYQLVARDHIPNTNKSYNKLGRIINNARLAGLVSWDAIEDRTRGIKSNAHWDSPNQVIEAALHTYKINKWENQPYYIEVWVEKDALIDVVSKACRPLDVPFFSCRGYTSSSEMWKAGHKRLRKQIQKDKHPIIIHLGDHDPSGIDMNRDIAERLALFSGYPVDVDRIALNMDQIQRYNPPPDPAKITDTRATKYIRLYGRHSWELDALRPEVLANLITEAISSYRDEELWQESIDKEEEGKQWIRDRIG